MSHDEWIFTCESSVYNFIYFKNTAFGGRNILTMSQSDHLPIYKDTFTMLGMVINRVKDYPRFYRYTVGEKMVNINLELLFLIYRANSSYENKHDDRTSN